ncbi:hypothetical protein JYB87_16460 [Shewanella avicenniae]|uniref:Uncharacterized protein n=1 Tax=Shewanella avicenniae TaxID=2814294 RepID=A0ABX7QQU3_9GAMM|nr:hypothetical protein [Shewanella avicenniae]QSX33296.1 hypothetical protein JYB87_16460 [Shewanella avicenniae]
MSRNIKLSISETKLAQLMLAGELCAADIQCLDRESKEAVWRLCLWCCSKRSGCQDCQQPCQQSCSPQQTQQQDQKTAPFSDITLQLHR